MQALRIGPAVWCQKLAHLLEPRIVVLDCHGQLEQLPEQILGAVEGDAQLAGPKVDCAGQPSRLRRRNRHGASPERCLGVLEVLGEALAPGSFLPEVAALLDRFELAEQGSAVDEKRLAGLVAAKPVHEFDGAAAPHAEDLLERGAVEDRSGQRGNSGADGGKS
jgi:hypothetical protein